MKTGLTRSSLHAFFLSTRAQLCLGQPRTGLISRTSHPAIILGPALLLDPVLAPERTLPLMRPIVALIPHYVIREAFHAREYN